MGLKSNFLNSSFEKMCVGYGVSVIETVCVGYPYWFSNDWFGDTLGSCFRSSSTIHSTYQELRRITEYSIIFANEVTYAATVCMIGPPL